MADTVSMLEVVVDGVPVIMTEFGYKSFSMVVKSIGYFTHRTSPTYLRTSGVMETRYGGQPKVSHKYPKPSVDKIIDLYKKNGITDFDTVVISPVLEVACYIGRAMNAPILPSQFIASAPNRKLVEQNNNSNNIYIVGHETDWPELCVWIKPKNLGELYSKIIDAAKNIVIFSQNSGPQNILGTCRGWFKDNVHILDGFTGDDNFRNRIQNPGKEGYCETHDKIPHWEFSMEYDQISELEKYCRNRAKNVVTISTGDWSGFIPVMLFKKMYELNGIKPEGITYHDYWACHPFYESEFARIPITNFQYGADLFLNEFRKLLESIDWNGKNGEYLVWPHDLHNTSAVNPVERFESWGFPTIYKTNREYDCWCYGWNDEPDALNPTREYIIPKLIGKKSFRAFSEYISIDDLIKICESVRKTDISSYRT